MKSAVIIGCGDAGVRSAGRISGLSGRVRVVGFCDLIGERAEALAEKYGGKAYTDVELMLGELEPDFAVVCVPPYCTEKILTLLIQRKIPLLEGLPVSIGVDGGESLVKLAKENDVPAFILDERAFSRGFRAAEMFSEKYAVIRAELSCVTPVPGKFWRRDDELSGGIMAEKGLEALAVLRGLFGEIDDCHTVTKRGYVSGAVGAGEAEAGYAYQTDDMLLSLLSFKNGTTASLTLGNYGIEDEWALNLYAAGKRLEWRGNEARVWGETYDPGKSKKLLREGKIIPDEYGGDVLIYRDDGKSSAEGALADLLDGRKTPEAGLLRPLSDAVELYEIGEKINGSMSKD